MGQPATTATTPTDTTSSGYSRRGDVVAVGDRSVGLSHLASRAFKKDSGVIQILTIGIYRGFHQF